MAAAPGSAPPPGFAAAPAISLAAAAGGAPLLIRQLFDAETGTFTYLLADVASRQGVLIDPVFEQHERDLSLIRELGIELIAYSPLALGLLARPAGVPAAFSRGPRALLSRRIGPRLQPLLQAMEAIARSRGSDPAAVALNWCRAHGAMPIPGLRRVAQAEAAAAALGWQLSGPERQELDALSRACVAAGAAMPRNPFLSD